MTQGSLLNNPISNRKYGRFFLLKCLVKFLHRVVLSWDVFRSWLDSKSWWCFQSHDGSMGRLFIYIHLAWIDGKCRWCIIIHGSFGNVCFLMFNFISTFREMIPHLEQVPHIFHAVFTTPVVSPWNPVTLPGAFKHKLPQQCDVPLSRDRCLGGGFKDFLTFFIVTPKIGEDSRFD